MRYVIAFLFIVMGFSPAIADTGAAPPLPRNCMAFYPLSAIAKTESGTATIAYHIRKDGSVADTSVAASSGSADIDEAAQRCVASWQFPTRSSQDGVHETTNVSPIAMAAPRPHYCLTSAATNDLQGATALAFRIAVDGHPSDIKVATSSGNEQLDTASLQCASNWRYKPAVRNGEPVEVPWQADIVWNMNIPPVETDSPERCISATPLSPDDLRDSDGTSVVSYVLWAGFLLDLRLAQSSGNHRLDNAALQCVKDIGYREVVTAGNARLQRLTRRINWVAALAKQSSLKATTADDAGPSISAGPVTPPQTTGKPHICTFAASHGMMPKLNPTLLSFTITAEGTVSDPHVIGSNGKQEVDDAAIACVLQWRYIPAQQDGHPVATPWKAQVNWQYP